MLTNYQIERVGYLTDGDVICRDCAVKDYAVSEDANYTVEELEELGWGEDDQELETTLEVSALDRYSAEENWPQGLSCGDCGTEIVETDSDYCIAHDGWRRYRAGRVSRSCEYSDGLAQARDCHLEVTS